MMFAKVIDQLRKVNLPIAILRFMLGGGIQATCCIAHWGRILYEVIIAFFIHV